MPHQVDSDGFPIEHSHVPDPGELSMIITSAGNVVAPYGREVCEFEETPSWVFMRCDFGVFGTTTRIVATEDVVLREYIPEPELEAGLVVCLLFMLGLTRWRNR